MNQKRLLPTLAVSILTYSCATKNVEPDDPNKINYDKTEVQYTSWKPLDMDGEMTYKSDFFITSSQADISQLKKEVSIKSGNNKESSFSDYDKSNSVIISFYKIKNKGEAEITGSEINYGQENWQTFKALIPGRSGNSDTDYINLSVTMLADRDKFETSVTMNLVETYGGNFTYREIPELQNKNQAFFKNYLKEEFQVRHVIIKGVNREQLNANGFYKNYSYNYPSLTKAFSIGN